MAGHGSAPDPDRALEPARQVHRDSGMYRSDSPSGPGFPMRHYIEEYRPQVGSGANVNERGTRFRWRVDVGDNPTVFDKTSRGGDVKTLKRAQASAGTARQRFAGGRDIYTGR